MPDTDTAPKPGICLPLPEQAHAKLTRLRDQLGLLSQISYAVTKEEERQPLELRRSVLGSCFELASLQLDDVLLSVDRARENRP